MLTMVLGGLWHGAAWTFVVWGTLHGLYLCAHRAFTERPGAAGPIHNRVGHFGRADVLPAIGTFQLVVFAWIFFRAESFAQAFDVIAGIVTLQGGVTDWSALSLLGLLGAISIAIDITQRNTETHTPMLSWTPVIQGAVYGAFVLGIVVFSGGETVPFIYFQF
jgi:D-alanyl-lipoteichoic acid acyltransferase DltB (MBOAT superfamily)